MDKQVLDDVYEFWFGSDRSPTHINPDRVRWWMVQNDDTDHQVRSNFGHLVAEAAQQHWDLRALSKEQAVALVVMFDQFPRNIYRTSGEAFAYDHLARDVASRLTADGWNHFTAMERFVLGLPFVHHEDVAAQDFAVMIVSHICVRAPDELREAHRFDLDQAIRHRDVIRRFGRFPHRNAMLGRISTPEEIEFLKTALRGRGF